MVTGIVRVEFDGTELVGRLHQGQPFVAMKPVVEGMGLDWDRQQKKLKGHPVLSKHLTPLRGVTGSDGKNYQMLCMPLARLPFWLATVNPSKVREVVRDRVVLFQEHAAEVLAEAFSANGKRQDALSSKRVAGTVMCRILHDTLVGLGRDPKGYDYATEHRLVNHCITGAFGGVCEDSLSTDQLKLQQELRMQNAVWIGQGMAYRERKLLLEQHAVTWCRTKEIGWEAPNAC